MTIREEIVKGLECHSDLGKGWPHNCPECPYKEFDDCDKILSADILAMLKSREPKLPRFECNYISRIGYCPACGAELRPWGVHYCHECGQEIKWEVSTTYFSA